MKADTKIGIAVILILVSIVAFLLGREIAQQRNRVKNSIQNDTEKVEEHK